MLLFNVYLIHVNYEIIFFVRKIFFLFFKKQKEAFLNHIESYHLSEINQINPLGMKGQMAEQFGVIIKHLWNGQYNWIDANQLRVCFI